MKLKVLELSTGKNKLEEWTFLPANWDHALARPPIFDQNFVFMDFVTSGNFDITDTGDILILNLVNRTKFWMRSGILTTQIREKAAGRIDLENFRDLNWMFASQMDVENDRIVIKFKAPLYYYSLGWFLNP